MVDSASRPFELITDANREKWNKYDQAIQKQQQASSKQQQQKFDGDETKLDSTLEQDVSFCLITTLPPCRTRTGPPAFLLDLTMEVSSFRVSLCSFVFFLSLLF